MTDFRHERSIFFTDSEYKDYINRHPDIYLILLKELELRYSAQFNSDLCKYLSDRYKLIDIKHEKIFKEEEFCFDFKQLYVDFTDQDSDFFSKERSTNKNLPDNIQKFARTILVQESAELEGQIQQQILES